MCRTRTVIMYRRLQKISLNGEWSLKSDGWDHSVPAEVPGDILSDLLRSGKIVDPYYRDQELEALALSGRTYTYEKQFCAEAEILSMEHVLLHFDGIDTLAEIYLNGELIGKTDNMHRTWEFDVRSLLQPEGNLLRVDIQSPTEYIRRRYAQKKLEGTSDAMRGFPYLRKAHYMFGWDWGARLPGGGLWRDVNLIAYGAARIDNVYIVQHHENGAVILEPQVCITGPGSLSGNGADTAKSGSASAGSNFTVEVEALDPNGTQIASAIQQIVGYDGSSQNRMPVCTLSGISIDAPSLWYPAGYGAQPLYTIRTYLRENDVAIDSQEMRIGLRTIEIARRKDEYGESFAHRVNGIEIFAMGADYIPEDHLTARTSRERTAKLLEDARAAHFNCIRVWGGGYYPEDWFYDICDELGLIVWQDFMFACAAYELSEDFEENIRRELIDNIKRLRHHASLGLWCGNNEMEQFAVEGQWITSQRERDDYVRMYEQIFPEIVEKYDPQTFYWPASPSSGGGFDEPNDENRGDVHYWDVWHGGKPFTEYRKFHFRYLSEFGFQAFPAMKTIESFTLPEDRNIYSYVMEKHQRNASANGKIAAYMAQTYPYPDSMDKFVYASQLLQAQAIRYGVEHFRRWRGRCMGTVIWQLNDCWPVISWSSIDYYGRWKALHYYAKRFFAPVLLSCEEEGILTQDQNPNAEPYVVRRSVRFNVSNETREDIEVIVRWFCADADGMRKEEHVELVEVPALSAAWLDRTDLPEADLYEDHVYYQLERDGRTVSQGSVLFCPPKYYRFRDPELEWRLEGDEIIVKASAYAKDVEIRNENEDLVLSDNYFDMESGERRVKILRGRPDGITIRSSYDITDADVPRLCRRRVPSSAVGGGYQSPTDALRS